MDATGHGELWMDWDSISKFSQYGWRCTTNDNDYSTKTLRGNWNEERCNIQRIVQPKPPPSQYTHCFEMISSGFEERHWFPGHHPELELPLFNTAQSCSTIDYRPPWQHFLCLCPTLREGTRRMEEKQQRWRQSADYAFRKTGGLSASSATKISLSKKTCHALKPNVASCEKCSSCFLSCIVCNLHVFLSFVLCAEVTLRLLSQAQLTP
ncbi:LOW QUALITY PROTEIN: cilia- and flagella-associated protein 68 [Theristicus caerulescens]